MRGFGDLELAAILMAVMALAVLFMFNMSVSTNLTKWQATKTCYYAAHYLASPAAGNEKGVVAPSTMGQLEAMNFHKLKIRGYLYDIERGELVGQINQFDDRVDVGNVLSYAMLGLAWLGPAEQIVVAATQCVEGLNADRFETIQKGMANKAEKDALAILASEAGRTTEGGKISLPARGTGFVGVPAGEHFDFSDLGEFCGWENPEQYGSAKMNWYMYTLPVSIKYGESDYNMGYLMVTGIMSKSPSSLLEDLFCQMVEKTGVGFEDYAEACGLVEEGG